MARFLLRTDVMIALCVVVFVIFYNVYSGCGDREKETNIYSLQGKSELSGSMFILGGSIDSEPKYYYYIKENEGYVLKSVRAEDCVIMESDQEQPKIIENYCDCWFGYSLAFSQCNWSKKNKIIVPLNTTYLKYNSKIE